MVQLAQLQNFVPASSFARSRLYTQLLVANLLHENWNLDHHREEEYHQVVCFSVDLVMRCHCEEGPPPLGGGGGGGGGGGVG